MARIQIFAESVEFIYQGVELDRGKIEVMWTLKDQPEGLGRNFMGRETFDSLRDFLAYDLGIYKVLVSQFDL
jgi:hypothetical protein